MKQILLTSLITVFLTTLCSSQVNILWESRFNNNGFDDYSVDIQVDASGNSYVVGSSYDGSQFNIITIKYDPFGAAHSSRDPRCCQA